MTAHARGDARRDAILAFVEDFWRRNGYGPTYREIGDGVGFIVPSSVTYQVKLLIDAGCMVKADRKPRTLRVVEA